MHFSPKKKLENPLSQELNLELGFIKLKFLF